jgi:oligoendopeptidase F
MKNNIEKIKTSWDLTPLFKSDKDPNIEKERKAVEKSANSFVKKWKHNDSYMTNSKSLREALDEYEIYYRKHGPYSKEYFYYHLKNSLNQSDIKTKAGLSNITDLSKKIENQTQFFVLNISKIEKSKQKELLKEPNLQKYKHFLEKIFEGAKYNLSEAEERIINLLDTTGRRNWVKMTAEFLSKEEFLILDEDGKKKKKNFEEIFDLIISKNKKVRDGAASAINKIAEKHLDVAEYELNSILKDKQINDELRGLERPDTSRHLLDDVDNTMVDVLVDSIQKRFSISHRYYRLKAKMFGLKKLKYYERNVEYGDVDIEYDFNTSVDIVRDSLGSLDKEFKSIFERFLKNGQIDVYPRKGKHGGAYCSNTILDTPTYILLNHTNKFRNVLAIAHEVGHGINSELMRKTCHSLSFDLSMCTAEVASTFMEDFIFDKIIKDSDKDMALTIMMQKLGDMVSTVQTQVACYLFEKDLHAEFRKAGYLSKEEIGKIFQKNMKAYMGEAVEQSPGSQNWWVYWSHIRSYFYTYSYASGLLISKALQNRVKKNPKEIEKVKIFLSAGTSDSPKNIFNKIGIDITKREFWNAGLDEIEDLLKEAEKLAKELGVIK